MAGPREGQPFACCQLPCATNLPATNWITVTNPRVAQDGSFFVGNHLLHPLQYCRLVRP
jgi:hypothetical protein